MSTSEPVREQRRSPAAGRRPRAAHVLAVVAHPDDEAFGLGAVLDAFCRDGSTVSVLSLTRGGAGRTAVPSEDLGQTRRAELAEAAAALGVTHAEAADYPDGGLAAVPLDQLAQTVRDALAAARPELLLVFDEAGITSHPDHRQATRAAVAAARDAGVPVLAWFLPQEVAAALNDQFGTAFAGRDPSGPDLTIEVDRTRQWTAITRHRSQAGEFDLVARRLELLGNHEHLRWLRAPDPRDRRDLPGLA